jgi:hypothetical protein
VDKIKDFCLIHDACDHLLILESAMLEDTNGASQHAGNARKLERK